jgi:hypothetical protein
MFLLTPKSHNRKTGPIPVTTTTPDSCPEICPFKAKGCYAKGGPLRLVWERSRNGLSTEAFLSKITELPEKILWRHNQAGDLPKVEGEKIDFDFVKRLTEANKGKKGFTYTHHDTDIKENREAIKFANENGFTVNLSGNNLKHADELVKLGIGPVVSVVPENFEGKFTPDGNKVVICPATKNEYVNCMTCGLCQKQRKAIVAFPAHSVSKKHVSKIASGELVA